MREDGSTSLTRNIERARKGDTDAWGEVYRELAPFVFRLCRRVLPTKEDAEDATAEVFLKVQIRLDQYDPARPFQPWLYRIAANHCWDELRKRRSRGEIAGGDADSATLESGDPGPDEQMLAEQTHLQIRSALSQLDDRARLGLVLRFYGELSYDEIAEVLGVTPSFVGVMLLRARRKLRRILAAKERS